MRITSITSTPLYIPSPRTQSALGVATVREFGLVEIETDQGVTGVGEISTIWDGKGKVQCSFVDNYLGPALINEDPTAINRCVDKMRMVGDSAWPARAAVEMALFDITGKVIGVPVYQLLGGKSREAIVLSHSVYMDTPDRMANNARQLTGEGYTCVKVKVGIDAGLDVERVAAVRDAIGPAAHLRLDANMGWRSAKDAIRNIRRLEPFGLHSVEQPVPRHMVDDLRRIRDSTDVPIMADESLFGPDDALALLRANAVDMFNVYVAESGGLSNAALIFRMAHLVGVPCVIGAMPELGIGTSAAVHLGISVPNLSDPCDACGVVYHDVDIIHESFDVHDGRIRPLEGPGLGVTVDRDAVKRFSKPRGAAKSRG